MKDKRPFNSYCNKCKKNICEKCFDEHYQIFKTKSTLKEKLKEIKKPIDKFNNNVNKLIKMLNKVKDYINTYYNIINNIINNYDDEKNNYEMLININQINDNKEIINDLDKINNENDMEKKFHNIVSIYNKFNQIRLELKVENKDIGKDIYFLGDNIKKFSGGKHKLLKELNEKNVELFIDNKCYKFEKYFKPEKEGIYNILINLKNINLKDCSGMFFNCLNLTNIDLSNFDTSNINRMDYMFLDCNNLADINL